MIMLFILNNSFEEEEEERAALMTVVAVSRMTRDLTAATGVAAVTSMVAVTPEVATVDCSSALLLSMVSFFFCCIVVWIECFLFFRLEFEKLIRSAACCCSSSSASSAGNFLLRDFFMADCCCFFFFLWTAAFVFINFLLGLLPSVPNFILSFWIPGTSINQDWWWVLAVQPEKSVETSRRHR